MSTDLHRASSNTSIRVERIEKSLKYDAAFTYLTKFYKRKAGEGGKPTSDLSEEIDLTGDSDQEQDMQPPVDELADTERPPWERDEEGDSMGIAAGLPCASRPVCYVSS
jgi:hypothetical protein